MAEHGVRIKLSCENTAKSGPMSRNDTGSSTAQKIPSQQFDEANTDKVHIDEVRIRLLFI